MIQYQNGSLKLQSGFIKCSQYAEQLKYWLHYFERNQFHIVDGHKLISEPWTELEKVEDFLNLKHELGPQMFYFSEAKGFYCFKPNNVSICK